MAFKEVFTQVTPITANTSAEGDYTIFLEGQSEVSVGGTFDGATVTFHSFSDAFGRGAQLERTPATVEDAFASLAGYIEFVVTNAGASTSLNIFSRPLVNQTY